MILIAPLAFSTSVNAQTDKNDIDWPDLEAITKDNLDRLTILAHASPESSEVSFLTSFYTGDSLLVGAILDYQHVYLLETDLSTVSIKALNSYPKRNVWEVAFSEQGNLLGIGGAEQADIWDLVEKQWTPLPFASVFYDLDFRPQTGTLGIAAMDQIIEWNLTTNSPTQTFVIPGALVANIDFSPDGNLVAVGLGSGVTLVDWENQQEIPVGLSSNPNREVLFSPDGTMLVYISEVGDDVALWNMYEDSLIQIKEEGVTELSEFGIDLDFSADGQLLWIVTPEWVEIYNGATGEFIDTVDQLSDDVNVISLSADGKLLVTGHLNGDVNIWGILRQVNN
jgi:WD40 repeat protein